MERIWMMWLDGDPGRSTEEVIREAMAYYQSKYGVKPNRVQLPLNSEKVFIDGILIERESYVQKNHLLMTMDREVEGVQKETGG